jgi:two-component system, OmpR family, phosphate regulon sensor histidine kinase PhoR
MRSRRLLWQLYPTYLAVFVVALAALTWFYSRTLHEFYYEQTADSLKARAVLLEPQVRGRLTPASGPALNRLCRELGAGTATRFTIILPSGEVLGDSQEDPLKMENHATRPEVQAALTGAAGGATRFSRTLLRDMMYVAVPVVEDGHITGVVRAAMAVDAIGATLDALYLRVALGGLAVVAIIALVSLWLSRRISRPLEEMTRGAARFAQGDLAQRLALRGSKEIDALVLAMNQMAAQLDDRIRAVENQRNEQEAMLASMVEGMLAVDTEERILRINRSAELLLGIRSGQVLGRRLQEVVRKADLQRFVARTLANHEPVEADLVLHDQQECFLQAHGTLLRGSDGKDLGALLVLNDVTRLHRLENLRRDFVANVSHELKTPITAIKGCVETLLDGAAADPDASRRFLEIIARQGERLHAIIDDLLTLSRIEQDAEKHDIPLQVGSLPDVVEAAIQSCSVAAGVRSVRLDLECPDEVLAAISPPLLEQALVNLIDNAVKYSDAGGRVLISVRRSGPEAVIEVRDWGCGIPREHLARLFERFYRVDKARSRKVGGTGLGLAIVKHIVQAHRGRVTVESTPEQGSVFAIVLPGVSRE